MILSLQFRNKKCHYSAMTLKARTHGVDYFIQSAVPNKHEIIFAKQTLNITKNFPIIRRTNVCPLISIFQVISYLCPAIILIGLVYSAKMGRHTGNDMYLHLAIRFYNTLFILSILKYINILFGDMLTPFLET